MSPLAGHGPNAPGRTLPGGAGPAGFTLIELIVVIVILAVLAGIAAPAFLSPPPSLTPMEEAVGRFEALFRLARDEAVRTATPVTVVLDSTSGMVWFDVASRPTDLSSLAGNTAGGSASDRLAAPRGGSSLATGGSFGGGSTLGQGLLQPGAGARVPADAQSLELPGDIRVQTFRARCLFTFTPGGSAVGDSLALRSSMGQRIVLEVDPWSGRVRVR